MFSVADLREGHEGRPPGSKFFQFRAVFGKIWQNRMLAPPGELESTPRRNPGSATGFECLRFLLRLSLGVNGRLTCAGPNCHSVVQKFLHLFLLKMAEWQFGQTFQNNK